VLGLLIYRNLYLNCKPLGLNSSVVQKFLVLILLTFVSRRALVALGTKQTPMSYKWIYLKYHNRRDIFEAVQIFCFECIAQIFIMFTVKLGIRITSLRRFCDIWDWEMRRI